MQGNIHIDSLNENAAILIKDYLYSNLKYKIQTKRPIIFLCIGSDRSTGDALGPLVGEKIKSLQRENIYVYGTLENPVHAQNIDQTINKINSTFNNPFIIALDACLGPIDKVGKIILKKAPVVPGIALNKELPHVGEISILGVVNISNTLGFSTLQSTRLFTVMKIANTISVAIHLLIMQILGYSKDQNLDFTLENILS